MERWDVYNRNGQLTNKTVVRGALCLKRGQYHLVVHIWVVDKNNRILIQRRSTLKEMMPGEWAATGGAAISGETSPIAASRELKEELGIVTNSGELKFIGRITNLSSFVDIWIVDCNIEIEELKLQASEVAEAKWVTVDELSTMIKNQKFHNYGRKYFSAVMGAVKTGRRNEFKY